ISVGGEVGAVEPRVFHLSNYLFYHAGYFPQLLVGCLVNNAEAEPDPALFHTLIVTHPAGHQVCVGEHQLLSTQSLEAGGLYSYALHGAHVVADDKKITDNERLIENNHQKSKAISQDVLECKSHGDASNSQSCDESTHMETHVIQGQYYYHHVKAGLGDDSQCGDRCHAGRIIFQTCFLVVLQPYGYQGAAQNCGLCQECQDKGRAQDLARLSGEVQEGSTHYQCDNHQQGVCATSHFSDLLPKPTSRRAGGEASQATECVAAEAKEDDGCNNHRGACNQPALRRIAQQFTAWKSLNQPGSSRYCVARSGQYRSRAGKKKGGAATRSRGLVPGGQLVLYVGKVVLQCLAQDQSVGDPMWDPIKASQRMGHTVTAPHHGVVEGQTGQVGGNHQSSARRHVFPVVCGDLHVANDESYCLQCECVRIGRGL